MKGTPVFRTLAETRMPREARTVRLILGLSSGQMYVVMAWEQLLECNSYSNFTSLLPSSCPSLSPFSLVEDQQSLWPILLTCVCLSLLSLSIMYASTWYTRMETCSLEEIKRLNLWSELQLFLVSGVMIQTRMGWGQAPRGCCQPRHELALADHDDDNVFKCCLHLLTQNIDSNCQWVSSLFSRQSVLKQTCLSFWTVTGSHNQAFSSLIGSDPPSIFCNSDGNRHGRNTDAGHGQH